MNSPAMPLYPGTIQFSGVGRNRSDFKAVITCEDDLWLAIKPYLFSNDVEFFWNPLTNEGEIVVGMLRCVGTFRKVIK